MVGGGGGSGGYNHTSNIALVKCAPRERQDKARKKEGPTSISGHASG